MIERKEPQKPLLIYALNNQGKTNILTSIFVCGHIKTAHSKMDLETCIQNGQEKAIIGLLYQYDLKQDEMQKMYATISHQGSMYHFNTKLVRQKKECLKVCPSFYISADTLSVSYTHLTLPTIYSV